MSRRRRPGDRELIRSLSSWWDRWRAWLGDALPEDGDIGPISLSDPPEFESERWRKAGEAGAIVAGAQARTSLRRIGLPTVTERLRLGIVAGLGGLDGTIEGEILTGWAQRGVDLITAVPRDRLGRLPAQIAEAAARGRAWRELRDEIAADLDVDDRHLRLIARDQAAKLQSEITEATQIRAGVESYTWTAILDGRTRPSHAAAHGTIVRWDSAGVPGTGFYGESSHAGRGGQCRCLAIPVAPDEW